MFTQETKDPLNTVIPYSTAVLYFVHHPRYIGMLDLTASSENYFITFVVFC
jgi:hypothetical protein